MAIAVGCDHRGLEAKQTVIKTLSRLGYEYRDFGCYTSESVDYPDIARSVAEAVTGGDFEQGILICGTGIGMCIAANKVKGIRAAICPDTFMAERARQHNNANILCLGAEWEGAPLPEIVRVFLSTEFEGERHQRRLDKIAAMER